MERVNFLTGQAGMCSDHHDKTMFVSNAALPDGLKITAMISNPLLTEIYPDFQNSLSTS